ncbi:hypothetical protein RZS08_10670, partial [Arthrospira platensis SPKY1]|nr:hypothetical protein [Arthrospira platensis SPKY1]
MAEKITIAELDLDPSKLIKRASDTKKAIDELSATQKTLNKDTDDGRMEFVKNEAQLKKLRAEYSQQTKAVSELIAADGTLLSAQQALET